MKINFRLLGLVVAFIYFAAALYLYGRAINASGFLGGLGDSLNVITMGLPWSLIMISYSWSGLELLFSVAINSVILYFVGFWIQKAIIRRRV